LTKAPVSFWQTLLSERSQVQEFVTDTGAFDWQVEDETGGKVVRAERQGKEPTLVLQVRFYARVVGGLEGDGLG
jgi:hypothetical protein